MRRRRKVRKGKSEMEIIEVLKKKLCGLRIKRRKGRAKKFKMNGNALAVSMEIEKLSKKKDLTDLEICKLERLKAKREICKEMCERIEKEVWKMDCSKKDIKEKIKELSKKNGIKICLEDLE